MSDTEARLTELENRFSYQEYIIQQLNEVIIAQQKQMDQQQRELDQLRTMLLQNESHMQRAHQEAPPPHY